MAKKKKSAKKNRVVFPISFLRIATFSFIRFLPILALIALTGFCLLGVKQYLYADSNFLLTNIKLLTDGDYSAEQVFRQANIQSGVHIFSVDLRSIAARLEQDPLIKEAQIKRELPSTLLVNLKLRKPIAYVQVPPEEKVFFVDRDGIFVSILQGELPQGALLIIDGASYGGKVQVGASHLSPGLEQAFRVMESVEALDVSVAAGNLSRIEIDRMGNFMVFFTNDLEVKLGNTDLSENLKKMPHALKILQEEGIKIEAVKYLDLRFDDIIIKKK